MHITIRYIEIRCTWSINSLLKRNLWKSVRLKEINVQIHICVYVVVDERLCEKLRLTWEVDLNRWSFSFSYAPMNYILKGNWIGVSHLILDPFLIQLLITFLTFITLTSTFRWMRNVRLHLPLTYMKLSSFTCKPLTNIDKCPHGPTHTYMIYTPHTDRKDKIERSERWTLTHSFSWYPLSYSYMSLPPSSPGGSRATLLDFHLVPTHFR